MGNKRNRVVSHILSYTVTNSPDDEANVLRVREEAIGLHKRSILKAWVHGGTLSLTKLLSENFSIWEVRDNHRVAFFQMGENAIRERYPDAVLVGQYVASFVNHYSGFESSEPFKKALAAAKRKSYNRDTPDEVLAAQIRHKICSI